MSQDDHGSLKRRQFVKRPLNVFPTLLVFCMIAVRCGNITDIRQACSPLFSSPVLLHVVERQIRCYPIQPCTELCVAPERMQRCVHSDECLLGDLFRRVMVSHKAESNVVRLLHVAFHQLPECGVVSRSGFRDKLLLAHNWLVSSSHAQTFCYVGFQRLDRKKVKIVDMLFRVVYERAEEEFCQDLLMLRPWSG